MQNTNEVQRKYNFQFFDHEGKEVPLSQLDDKRGLRLVFTKSSPIGQSVLVKENTGYRK